MKRVFGVAVCGVVLAGCVAHPVGPARTDSVYEGKARTTAKSVQSSLETGVLAARAAARDRAFGPYISVVLSESEEAANRVEGTFDSIQPPSGASLRLRSELDDLLTEAVDQLAEARILARWGRLPELGDKAGDLEQAAKKLDDFQKAHGG